MKPKASSGYDKISNKFVKMIGEVISYPLSKVINLYMEQGKVPNNMKKAR